MAVCPGCGRCSHCGHAPQLPTPPPAWWSSPTFYPFVTGGSSTLGTVTINTLPPDDGTAGVGAKV